MPEENHPELAPTVREFIAAEATRRGIGFDECRRVLGQEIFPEGIDQEEGYDEAWEAEINRRRESLQNGDAKPVSFQSLAARIQTLRQ